MLKWTLTLCALLASSAVLAECPPLPDEAPPPAATDAEPWDGPRSADWSDWMDTAALIETQPDVAIAHRVDDSDLWADHLWRLALMDLDDDGIDEVLLRGYQPGDRCDRDGQCAIDVYWAPTDSLSWQSVFRTDTETIIALPETADRGFHLLQVDMGIYESCLKPVGEDRPDAGHYRSITAYAEELEPEWSPWTPTGQLDENQEELALAAARDHGADSLNGLQWNEWRFAMIDLNDDGNVEGLVSPRAADSHCARTGETCMIIVFRDDGRGWEDRGTLLGVDFKALTEHGPQGYREIITSDGFRQVFVYDPPYEAYYPIR